MMNEILLWIVMNFRTSCYVSQSMSLPPISACDALKQNSSIIFIDHLPQSKIASITCHLSPWKYCHTKRKSSK